ncbi:rod shape-determining protein MreC [Candidatus Parcubacteria bacterium]|nr:rod shape-determining protein MreC [Candidatus Parcubacteria bacterium]
MNMYAKNKNPWWKKTLIGVAVLAIFMGSLMLFESPIKNVFYYLMSPLLEASWRAGGSTSGFLAPFFEWKSLAGQRDATRKENEALIWQVASLQDSLKELQHIKEAGENTSADNFTLATVRALGQDTTSDFILIDEGSEQGISENMPVISSTKVLYGKVVKVYNSFSQVMLISNKNSVVDVKIENADAGEKPVLGAVKGSGGFSLYLDLVSSDAELAQQDNIVTSGQEGIFPRNLLIGMISTVHKNDAKPFQTADVQPFFDVKNMDNLFVITNYLKK